MGEMRKGIGGGGGREREREGTREKGREREKVDTQKNLVRREGDEKEGIVGNEVKGTKRE
jgi:hypothetical protein